MVGVMRRSRFALRHNGDLNVASHTDHLLYEVVARPKRPVAVVLAAEIDLRDAPVAGESHQLGRGIRSFQQPRFQVQIAGEVEVLFQRLAMLRGQTLESRARRHRHGPAFGMEEIRGAFGAANQSGSERVRGQVDQQSFGVVGGTWRPAEPLPARLPMSPRLKLVVPCRCSTS